MPLPSSPTQHRRTCIENGTTRLLPSLTSKHLHSVNTHSVPSTFVLKYPWTSLSNNKSDHAHSEGVDSLHRSSREVRLFPRSSRCFLSLPSKLNLFLLLSLSFLFPELSPPPSQPPSSLAFSPPILKPSKDARGSGSWEPTRGKGSLYWKVA